MPQSNNIWDLFDLKGKIFLVAGGSRDLGKDMALALAEAHADGLITSRNPDQAAAAAADISKSTGQKVVGRAMDAHDEADIAAAVKSTVETFGRIDILINNVGGGFVGKDESPYLEKRSRAAWDRMININLTATFLMTKYVADVMMKQQSGSIINIASIAGMLGRQRKMYADTGLSPQTLDYATAKGGVISFSMDAAAYLGPFGVRVNAISPGGFKRGQPQPFIDAYSERTLLGRMGQDGVDLKGAAVYLASNAAAYVTGHNLVVDGGFSMSQ